MCVPMQFLPPKPDEESQAEAGQEARGRAPVAAHVHVNGAS